MVEALRCMPEGSGFDFRWCYPIILRGIYRKWVGEHGLDRSGSGRDRGRGLVNVVMNLRVPQNAGRVLIDCEPVSFSRRALLLGVSKYLKISLF